MMKVKVAPAITKMVLEEKRVALATVIDDGEFSKSEVRGLKETSEVKIDRQLSREEKQKSKMIEKTIILPCLLKMHDLFDILQFQKL